MRQFKIETGNEYQNLPANRRNAQSAHKTRNVRIADTEVNRDGRGAPLLTGHLSDLVSPERKPEEEETHMTSEYGSQVDDHEYSDDYNEQAKSGSMRKRAYIPSAVEAAKGQTRFH